MLDTIRRYAMIAMIAAGSAWAVAQPAPAAPPAAGATQAASRLAPDDFDFKQLLGNPPAAGSPEQAAEIDKLLDLQKNRTPDEVRRCQAEAHVKPFDFAPLLGKWFTPEKLPETDKLLQMATDRTKPIFGAAKAVWNRPRPFKADNRIQPCIEEENSASYPSGHATRGIVWATVLSQLMPDKKDLLMAYGREIGDDRALAGMHFPSDVVAGQTLGRVIADRLLADPDFKAQLEKAQVEIKNMRPVKLN